MFVTLTVSDASRNNGTCSDANSTVSVTVTAQDASGNQATCTATVTVEHDFGHGRTFNSPTSNNSTTCNGKMADIDLHLDPANPGYTEDTDYGFTIVKIKPALLLPVPGPMATVL